MIRSLENRKYFLKETTKKVTSQEERFLNFLRTLMTAVLPLMKNVLTPLAKSVLVSLGLTAAASTTDAAIQKKIFVSGTTTLMISKEDMEDIMKIVKSLEESGLLIICITKAIKNEAKEQKGGFFEVLLCTLGASLLGNMLPIKGATKGSDRVIPAGEGVIRASQDF